MKKIIIIVLATILCLSVVGGCFALYSKEVEDFTFTFGAEDAVTLTLTTTGLSDDRTFTFGGANAKINPSTSVSQDITLDVNTTDKGALQGLKGTLSVAISGDLANNLQLEIKNGETTYEGASVDLALNALPKNLKLILKLKASSDETTLDEEFKTLTGKTASIKVSWKFKDEAWSAVDGGYYIVSQASDWKVNKNAIYMDKNVGTEEGHDIAAIEAVYLKEGEEFKIVKYTTANGIYWMNQVRTSNCTELVGQITEGDGAGNLYVNTTGTYFCCVNKDGQIYIGIPSGN